MNARGGWILGAIAGIAIAAYFLACAAGLVAASEISSEDLRRWGEDIQKQQSDFLSRINLLSAGVGASVLGALLAAIKMLWSELKRARNMIIEAQSSTLQQANESFQEMKSLIRENLESSAKNREILKDVMTFFEMSRVANCPVVVGGDATKQ
jgi:hypothetical protein